MLIYWLSFNILNFIWTYIIYCPTIIFDDYLLAIMNNLSGQSTKHDFIEKSGNKFKIILWESKKNILRIEMNKLLWVALLFFKLQFWNGHLHKSLSSSHFHFWAFAPNTQSRLWADPLG